MRSRRNAITRIGLHWTACIPRDRHSAFKRFRDLRMSAFYTAVARFYDAENVDKNDDLDMYSRLAADSVGETLDVGCGTGRILLHLARDGRRVHGIDNDRAMLDRLERKLEAQPHLRQLVSYQCGDIHDLKPENKFQLVLLSYNLLMHFQEQKGQIALFRKLRGCLAADGQVVIDLPNPGPAFAAEDNDSPTLERKFLDPDSGHLIMLQSITYLDRAAQVLHVEWVYDEIDGDGVLKRMIAPHQLRYFFLPELRLLLAYCGLRATQVYGDTEGAPYQADSERLIVHAKAV